MPLSIVCAWCRKALGTLQCEASPEAPGAISHSICAECANRLLREIDSTQSPNREPNTHKKEIDPCKKPHSKR